MTAVAARVALGWPRLLVTGALVGGGAILLVGLLDALPDDLAWDFRAQYYPAAEAVADGRQVYVAPDDPALEPGDDVLPYVYPPQLAVALVPLTALSLDAATVVMFFVCLVSLLGSLAVLGVRDLRCYAAVLVWPASWNALEVVNVTPILLLGMALAWRWRATVWPLATTLGLTVAVKILLWPLLVWTVANRRLRPTVLAILVGAGTTLVAWGAIGFQGLVDYPAMLRRLSEVQGGGSYSLVGVAEVLGLGSDVGRALMILVGGALLVVTVALGRRGDEQGSFVAAVGAALALTPIAWVHYLGFLAVPLAITRPRFTAVWLLPLVAWASPRLGHGDGLETLLPALVAAAVLSVLLVDPRESRRVAGVEA